jgi:DNA-binding transcriptional LysR family regulator
MNRRGFGAARLQNAEAKVHNLAMFDWNDLKHFLAVARHGSTLAAAKALGVNQSTVHRRLQELEAKLGQQLVIRRQTGYALTETGAEMVAYAARVEEAALAIERRIAAAKMSLQGPIILTCPEAVGIRLIRSPLVAMFEQQYPDASLEFVMSDRLLDLSKGEADIAIRGTEPDDESLFARKIADSRWAIYASRKYLQKHGQPRSVTEIGEHALILFDVELAEHLSNRWLRTVAPNAGVGARCNSISGLLSAAKSGAGLATLPIMIGDGEAELIRVLGPIADLTTPFYLVGHRDLRHAPRIRAFIDFMVANLRTVRPLLGS